MRSVVATDVATTPSLAPSRRIDFTQSVEPPAPDTARVMVIAPGHTFATRDVFDGAVNGLAALGVDVLAFPYHEEIVKHMPLEEPLRELGSENPGAEILLMASNAAMPRAMAFRPNLILFITGYVFPQAPALLLGQYAHTVVFTTEGPYQSETEEFAQLNYRTVFTNERACVERFKAVRREQGHPNPDEVYYLPHSFDPVRHHPRDPDPDYASDVCFVGSPFPERQALFGGVNWDGIALKTFGLWAADPSSEFLDVDRLQSPEGFISNDEAHQWYAGAKIVINHHRSIRYYGRDEHIADGDAESINPRTYELAAAGVFQVCDDSRPELRELFGDSIPTYRQGDSASLERLVRYYLTHPRERAACAAAAYRRVQPHRVQARMQTVLDVCLGDRAVTRKALHASQ